MSADLDAKSGFWQVKLTENSSYLTTFNTHFQPFLLAEDNCLSARCCVLYLTLDPQKIVYRLRLSGIYGYPNYKSIANLMFDVRNRTASSNTQDLFQEICSVHPCSTHSSASDNFYICTRNLPGYPLSPKQILFNILGLQDCYIDLMSHTKEKTPFMWEKGRGDMCCPGPESCL